MFQENPITPPPDLVNQWITEGYHQDYCTAAKHAIVQAARWGADQELKACCEWLLDHGYDLCSPEMRKDRRPKPLTLKEQALALIRYEPEKQPFLGAKSISIIRRALESLPEEQ
jgi:hypothetical protein